MSDKTTAKTKRDTTVNLHVSEDILRRADALRGRLADRFDSMGLSGDVTRAYVLRSALSAGLKALESSLDQPGAPPTSAPRPEDVPDEGEDEGGAS